MVNVSKLAQIVTKSLMNAQTLAKKEKLGFALASATIFEAGTIFGNFISGDTVEKEQPKQQVVQKKQPAKKSEQPNEEDFKYAQPEVGKDGYVKADTSYVTGTKTIGNIVYTTQPDSTGVVHYHTTFYDKNGKFNGFKIGEYRNGKDVHRESREFNKKGEKIAYNYEDDNYEENSYTNVEMSIDDRFKYNPMVNYSYNKKKHIGTVEYYGGDKDVSYYDKNDDKMLKEKHFKYSDLKYTVIPKYDKDGDVIKNDTIWNKQ